MTKAPTVTPAFECRPWKVQQRDHVSTTLLNEMTSCTAAARAVKTDAAARINGTGTRKHEYGGILVAKHSHPTTVGRTQQSTASKKWQAPCAFNTKSSVCLMNARSKAPKLFTQCGVRIRMQPVKSVAERQCQKQAIKLQSDQGHAKQTYYRLVQGS